MNNNMILKKLINSTILILDCRVDFFKKICYNIFSEKI